MDNTYNPHKDVSGAYGHGHTGWYAPNDSSPYGEVLGSGSTETFAYNGCTMTLRVEDDHKDLQTGLHPVPQTPR